MKATYLKRHVTCVHVPSRARGRRRTVLSRRRRGARVPQYAARARHVRTAAQSAYSSGVKRRLTFARRTVATHSAAQDKDSSRRKKRMVGRALPCLLPGPRLLSRPSRPESHHCQRTARCHARSAAERLAPISEESLATRPLTGRGRSAWWVDADRRDPARRYCGERAARGVRRLRGAYRLSLGMTISRCRRSVVFELGTWGTRVSRCSGGVMWDGLSHYQRQSLYLRTRIYPIYKCYPSRRRLQPPRPFDASVVSPHEMGGTRRQRVYLAPDEPARWSQSCLANPHLLSPIQYSAASSRVPVSPNTVSRV